MEAERYYKSFIKEMEDYQKVQENEMTKTDFILEHIYPGLQKQIDEDYKRYKDEYEDDPEDLLTMDEWITEVYEVENEEELEQYIEDHKPLDIEVYKSDRDNYKYEIQLAAGGPGIMLYMSESNKEVMYGFYWGGDRLEQYCNWLYDIIYDRYNLECYE